MKKNILLLIFALVIAIIPISFVKAAEIKTLYINQDFNDIIIKGSTDENVMAVNVEIYNEDESLFIKKFTLYVQDDNTFKTNLKIENGKYIVKVADYDGGEYLEAAFNKEEPYDGNAPEEEKETSEKTPETLDKVSSYILMFGLSILGIIACIKYKKVKN